ncbi:hypothetical protein T440DRAFT_524556 [Plenodomus tracheiphilus IPT5]|uniref:Metallo-dependent phosphatase n=1 Tax=Plenodomus tracheiphilus IPT5 TaxID=1408161 RepID=A0A6A7BQU0_9PLEO|nr:hypothetical protein T440DRAFT_524556 [Plenodomus tracheiphilus IPT5]
MYCSIIRKSSLPISIAKALEDITKIPAELKQVIAGNNEISPDEKCYLEDGGNIMNVDAVKKSVSTDTTSLASKGGTTYGIFLTEGTHTFTLSTGAIFSISASPYTPAYGVSGVQYPTNEDRFNLPAVSLSWAHNVSTEITRTPEDVDIVMTYGPPKAIERAKPRLVCFGHMQRGYGAQKIGFGRKVNTKEDADPIVPLAKEFASLPPGCVEDNGSSRQTQCINAAIEAEKCQLENAPWVVDLDL